MSVFLEQLKNISIDKDIIFLGDLKTAVSGLATFEGLITEKPIGVWEKRARQQKSVVDTISEFQERYDDFSEAAKKLERIVYRIIRSENAMNKLDQLNDVDSYKYFVGKLYGESDEELQLYLSRNLVGLQDIQEKVLSDREVKRLIEEYTRKKDAVFSSIQNIKSL